ncbi:hypothetical protein BGZ96_006387 [Linnemannia gamsii]|uniref:Uncharacterized protein n=1 Tax=Linnemannia gamsii TaxID=64522 RepID=A0ABQ7K3R3_9FUNG|nr:hypothetical protein BGZ96_006387 [Linnemannia gamsii]
MRSTILLVTAALLAFTSTTAAQANQAFCTTCIVTASIRASPLCDGLQNQAPPTSGSLTLQQKTCYCGLASAPDSSWIQPCVGPTSCDPTTVAMVLQTYANLKSVACEGMPAPAPATPATAAGGNSTTASNTTAPSTTATPPPLTVLPPVSPANTFPSPQQPGNAAPSSTASPKVAVSLAAIAVAVAVLL